VFRFPFLHEGDDLASHRAIREHLRARGYRIAEVTMDFGDWAWNDPYARCAAKKDEHAIAALEKSYLETSAAFRRYSIAQAREIFGRPIKHVLLLHAGALDARVMDDLLTRWERAGVRFISLDEAMADPIYRLDPERGASTGDTLLDQIVLWNNPPHPPGPLIPVTLLDAICR
jgi:hypothetical protein